jgi:hypothetical protein
MTLRVPLPATDRKRASRRVIGILQARARRLISTRANLPPPQPMPTRRNKALLSAVIAVIVLAILGGGYGLWQKLSRPAADARRDSLAVLPAAAENLQAANPAAVDLDVREMPRIEPGTVITKRPTGWTNLVLHGVPRVAEGDVDRVSGMVSRLVSMFHLTILANIVQDRANPPQFQLGKVALGLAMNIKGREVIVSSKTHEKLGASLRLIEENALSGNEACLNQALQMARTPTMVVFETTAIMRLKNENRNVFHRYVLLVSPTDGRLTTFVGALERDSQHAYHLATDEIRKLVPGVQEDRKLYVDRQRFVLGLPAQEAFALIDLPPGETILPSAELQQAAESVLKTPADVTRLEELLRSEIAQAPGQPGAQTRQPRARARDL